MAYNINKFIDAIDGVFRPTLYIVSFRLPDGVQSPSNSYEKSGGIAMGKDIMSSASEILSYTCKSATLPASTVGAIEIPFMGRKIKYPGDRTYEDWSTTFIIDANLVAYKAIINWHIALNTPNGNIGLYQTGSFKTQMTSDLYINLYQTNGKKSSGDVSVTLKNAYPVTADAISLDWDSTDTAGEISVTWQYDYAYQTNHKDEGAYYNENQNTTRDNL